MCRHNHSIISGQLLKRGGTFLRPTIPWTGYAADRSCPLALLCQT